MTHPGSRSALPASTSRKHQRRPAVHDVLRAQRGRAGDRADLSGDQPLRSGLGVAGAAQPGGRQHSGAGAVLRQGMKKLAVYRRPDGSLERRSAVCTHLGCIVHWNSLEQSWDCPAMARGLARMGTS